MSRFSDFPEDQDDYVSHEDYVQSLKDRIEELEKVVEAAMELNSATLASVYHYDRLDRALKELDGE